MSTIHPINFDPNSVLGQVQDKNYDQKQYQEKVKERFSHAAPVAENKALNHMRGVAQKVIEKVSEPDFLTALEGAHQAGVRDKFCQKFNESVMGSISLIPAPLRNEAGRVLEIESYMYSYLLHSGRAGLQEQLKVLAHGSPSQSLSKFKEDIFPGVEKSVLAASENLRNIDLDPQMKLFSQSKNDNTFRTDATELLTESEAIPLALGRALDLKEGGLPSGSAFTLTHLRSMERDIIRARGLQGVTGNIGNIDDPAPLKKTIKSRISAINPFLDKGKKGEGFKPAP